MKKAKYLIAIFLLGACTTVADYEICDTENCGDPVEVIVE